MESAHTTRAATGPGIGDVRRGALVLILALFLLLPVYGAARAAEHPAGGRFPTIVVYVGFG
ncbi:MAG TPA: hypothetical protein VF795_11960 [Desulfuromonadaceae bacterium]